MIKPPTTDFIDQYRILSVKKLNQSKYLSHIHYSQNRNKKSCIFSQPYIQSVTNLFLISILFNHNNFSNLIFMYYLINVVENNLSFFMLNKF